MKIQIAIPSRAGDQPRVTTMKVWPKDDTTRTMLSHPTHGGFLPPPSTEPADWPNDTYTFRRMRDGDLLDTEPKAAKPAKPKE